MTQIGAISVKISADDSSFQAATKRTTQAADQTAKQLENAAKRMDGFSKAAAAAGQSSGRLGQVAQQAGFQVQDFIVQVQGGQSAFVAFGQQGSQLAGLLGPGGAVLGAVIALGAAIGGTLVAAMDAAGKKSTELPAELLVRLDEIKQRYAEIDKESQKAFSQVELGKLGNEVGAVTSKILQLKEANEQLIMAQQNSADPRALRQYEQQIAANESRIRSLTKEQNNLAELMRQVGQELIVQSGDWEELTSEVEKTDGTLANLINQLTAAEMRFTQGELAARLYAAALATGKSSADELDSTLRSKIETVYQLEQAQDAATEAARRLQEQDKLMRDEMLAGMRQEMQARQEYQQLQNDLAALNDPVERARQELAERLAVVMEYHELENEAQALQYETGAAAYQAYQDRLNEIETRAADQKLAIQERTENAIISMRQAALGSAINLLDQFAGKSKAAAIASITISKGLALAQNAQNTLVAQTRALAELGPILGPPAAAKIGLYGKVNAALIAATGLAQAANVGRGNAQVFSGGVPAVNTTSGSSGQAQPSRNISISLTGSSFGAGGIRDLISEINAAIGDGVRLNVTG